MTTAHPTRSTALAIILAAAAASAAHAQSGGSFTLRWSSIDAGGLVLSHGGDFTLAGSFGQPDAAGPSGDNHTLAEVGGYWSWFTPTCGADFNRDGFLDFFDYDDFVNCFENSACPPGRSADYNADGFIDFFDYDEFVADFEAGC